MKENLFRFALACATTGFFLYKFPALQNWVGAIIVCLLFLGLFWVVDSLLNCLFFLWEVCTAARETCREFEEPEDDAVIECDVGPLIECDTAGIPTPPNEVLVHEYLWNAAHSAYELTRVIPLSEYTAGNPDAAQVLSRSPQPLVIPGAPVPARPQESEFDEVERRLQAPAFRHRTAGML